MAVDLVDALASPRVPARTRRRPSWVWRLVALVVVIGTQTPAITGTAVALETPPGVLSELSAVVQPTELPQEEPVGILTARPQETAVGPAPNDLRQQQEAPRPRSPAVSPSPTPTPARTTTGGGETPPSSRPSATAVPTRPQVPPLVGSTVREARRVLRAIGAPTAALENLSPDATITRQLQPTGPESLVVAVEDSRVPLAPLDQPAEPLREDALDAATGPLIDELLEQCERLNRDFEPADLIFDAEMEMRVGEASAVPVEVTLDRPATPQLIAGRTSVPVQVTCQVKAQLIGAAKDFQVEPAGWQTESLITRRTAQWSWLVTPQRAGEATLVLEMVPVLRVDQPGASPTAGYVDGSTYDQHLRVDVTAPWDESVTAGLDRLGAMLTSAKGAVVALTALVVAVVALGALLRKRKSHEESLQEGA